MSIEKAANNTLTEGNLETTSKVRMFSVWYNTFGNALAETVATVAASARAQGQKQGNMSFFIILRKFYEKLSTMMEILIMRFIIAVQ
jgi:hypothetical protein